MKKYLTSCALLAVMASAAQADTYQATNWMAPSHILNSVAYEPYLKEIDSVTEGRVSFELYSSGALVPAPTTLQALGDGVAQLGIVAASYTPSELPLSGLINDLAFLARDDFAAAFALTEIGLTNPDMLAEYSKHGTVFLGGYSTPVYNLFCMKELGGPESLKGLKIRTAGTAQNEWIAFLQAVPVAVPMTDVYTGLERGSLDCTLSDPTNLEFGYKFKEIVKVINTLPQGTSLGATYVLNKDFWAGLELADRRAILDATALGLARAQVAYQQGVETGFAAAAGLGVKTQEADPALLAKLEEFQSGMLGELAGRTMEARGIADPSPLIEEYLRLSAKWTALLEGVDRNDAEAVGKILHDEVFAKLDAESFGLN
ncbi:C4-dicarboxylate TRAP transporter substrate-binding protein [Pseudogemmobacter faecipullorum]|uniref:C4-dicarboxylate TRAP transporter substrate-binding protein n=1 Tax=Pseudogemmobacter faecipullorum TaxID=2755041 RepID=A0ABS8CLY3_9RHOB|nr:C4-dicarboxylate TRAP transporter substrate-binding protein [Pseudogemmobacter faecipullorum]MCB5410402.1 C4-dicarboxylate TRAP transporter substrate-binding protein [Pseudogemmobacter faecipullorum]